MNNNSIDCQNALKRLKAGFHLFAIIDKSKETFKLKDNKIIVISSQKGIFINEYSFLDIYKNVNFYINDDNDENPVDIKKDEEYYSWRQ